MKYGTLSFVLFVFLGPVRKPISTHTKRDRVPREVWSLHTRSLCYRSGVCGQAQVRDAIYVRKNKDSGMQKVKGNLKPIFMYSFEAEVINTRRKEIIIIYYTCDNLRSELSFERFSNFF